MSDRTRDANDASRPTTILDPLRPAVVVRRRVYDAALDRAEETSAQAFTMVSQPPSRLAAEDEENGPPSSINVARALASLRADELARVEELVRADEEAEAEAALDAEEPSAPPPPSVPAILVGKTIVLSDLADKIGIPANELPATLVARGYYALTAKTVIPRETARVIAESFGFRVEDGPDQEETTPAKSGQRSRIATKSKAKAKVATKTAAKTKTTRRRLAR